MAASVSAPSAADTLDAKIPFPSSSLRLHLKKDYDFNDKEQTTEKDRVYIAVLGASGSGKSSFINTISGSELKVNHDLEPHEHPVQLGNEFELDGRLITLIDTPGLDVSNGVNVNIMRGIFAALKAPTGMKLHGVIFLHSIFAELPGFSKRLFSLSKNLCIEKDLRKLVVVKTSWAEPGAAPEQIKMRELQVDSFFKPAQIQGASVVYCDFELDSTGTFLESTHQLIRSLLEPLSDNQVRPQFYRLCGVCGVEQRYSWPTRRMYRALNPPYRQRSKSLTKIIWMMSQVSLHRMRLSRAASSGKRERGSRYHKNAPRRYFLYASQKQRTRSYTSETTRRRRNRDNTDIRVGLGKLFGEQRNILARVGRLRARLRRMAT